MLPPSGQEKRKIINTPFVSHYTIWVAHVQEGLFLTLCSTSLVGRTTQHDLFYMPLSDLFSSFISITLITSNKKTVSCPVFCLWQTKFHENQLEISWNRIEINWIIDTDVYISCIHLHVYLIIIIHTDVHVFFVIMSKLFLYVKSQSLFVSMVKLYLGVQHYRICMFHNMLRFVKVLRL